ncbi:type II toxin-antitoxin system Phd/YefM family antitoxin [Geovibrio thiophilus]|uniref:Type II toxin-antitoxin system Phd/YefM family antitoxin n=1 Tax=Geovibrio thiophilus TaxID=139438 RepID=A0A410JXT0_9BACT|nr:type II toxin-antitoxin system Phd/YefM family antitoxin [Geovibrio thiophilus]QAR32865.1 type II toxin-antitoxin system Phd/YefM family antitoxin [Geovibrio thiophilus]
MNRISANDVKTKGVSALENETLITVRGEDKFVVLDMEYYNYLRGCELEKAIADSLKDLESGKYYKEPVEAHIRRIANEI